MRSKAFLLVAVLATPGAAAQEFTETVDVRLEESCRCEPRFV